MILRTITTATIAMTLAFATTQFASAQVHTDTVHHRFENAEQWAKIFESPERVEWQQPDKVVEAMNLHDGMTVIDIGAGTGFFTRRFAKAIAPNGHAIGLDVEPDMIRLHEGRRAKTGFERTTTLASSNPTIRRSSPHSADVVFFCDTLHHIDDRAGLPAQPARGSEAGRASRRHRFQKGALPVGPPPEHKLASAEVIAEFREAGYRLLREHDFLKYQYFLEFVPDSVHDSRLRNDVAPCLIKRTFSRTLRGTESMHDLVIRNGKIVDGTGKPAFIGDVAIDGGKITSVGGKAGLQRGAKSTRLDCWSLPASSTSTLITTARSPGTRI